ncbi:MAG: hypothetical protein U0X40_10940 [Ferruginibacter sp.]
MNRSAFITLFAWCAGISLFTSCASNEIGNSRDVAQQKIYQDYMISYEEGATDCSLDCQFRFAGSRGTTLLLSAPSKIEVDGTVLKADSSSIGAFYRYKKPVQAMYGEHRAVFTDINGKTYANKIVFPKFSLVDVPATASRNQPLSLHFDAPNLGAGDFVRIESVDADTSLTLDTQGNERFITIPAAYLGKIKASGISFMAKLRLQAPLQQGTEEGGRIYIWYETKPVKIKLQ